MARRVEWKAVGKCKVCGINLYAETDNKPHKIAMPCNLGGCPYETPEQQQSADEFWRSLPPAGKGVTYYE
jgi:hypothetical protein